ncbi:MAG: hypothetical protein IH586_13795, partial [Anaerolineaceae bacterium]|nr:hypothetical protein [Anaerolineaceae bacterium]
VVCLGLLGGPFLLYQFIATQNDALLSGWNAQNLTFTPNFWDVLLSFSPVIFFAIPGWVWLLRQKGHPEKAFLILWPVFGLLLAYLPLSLQRRFTFGYYLPLVILAIYGIDMLRVKSPRIAKWVMVIVITFSLPTNILLVSSGLFAAGNHPPMLFLTKDESQTIAWVESELPMTEVILASPEMSLFIPALSGRRIIYAHPFETVKAAQKEQEVLAFYQQPSWSAKKALFLEENQIHYVIYGPRELEFGENPDVSHLSLVNQIGSVKIYSFAQSP